MRSTTFALTTVFVLAQAMAAAAATYYVSPKGDDSADGQSAEHPWKSYSKVQQAPLHPGDTILFQRRGQWRERLQASTSGAPGNPITYDAYGDGPRPTFWGSDVLVNAHFEPAGPNQFSYPIAAKADSALVDHVFIPSSWKDGVLTITTRSDPRTDGKLYTACTRGNELFSNGKSHLVFRNLIVDETAAQLTEGPNQGYGVRIEGSTDVLVESCEALRCGRHNFAAINSTDFVGRHLRAAYVVPNMPGDNTPYVSYADTGAPVAHCVTTWDDIVAEHMEDGHGGRSNMFVSHGDHVGLITMTNSVVTTKISFLSAPVVVKKMTLRETASIENFGVGVLIDGVTLLDSSAIDQWGSNGTIQNCVASLTPTGGGPTGYGTAIVCRDKTAGNVIRFNTLVTKNFTGLCLAGSNASVRWYGNIVDTPGNAIVKASGPLTPADVAMADYNFYAGGAKIGGEPLDAARARGSELHSMSGDPQFVDPTRDYRLKPTSSCVGAADVKPGDVPPTDAMGHTRATTGKADIGALSVMQP